MNLTKIDWLGFRSQSQPMDCIEALRGTFGDHGDHLATTPIRPKNGFDQTQVISIAGLNVGLINYGGAVMRGWVRLDLSGVGCEWISDWDNCESHLSELDRYETRRVDIALDTGKREVTHEKVLEAYRSGMFVTSGRPPSMTRIEPEDPTDGRTIYIGKRDQPKFLRAYDKGYELAAKYPGIEVTEIDGVPIADMYRLELELKAKHRPLPVDLIENRDQYFAGAFPYLQSVLDVEPQVLKLSRDKAPQRSLASMLGLIRHQYGNSLFTALAAYQGDVGAVMDKIMGSKHNEALVAAGVLLVDHE